MELHRLDYLDVGERSIYTRNSVERGDGTLPVRRRTKALGWALTIGVNAFMAYYVCMFGVSRVIIKSLHYRGYNRM
jgi:hypothetical protein